MQFIWLYWWIWILINLLKFTRCYHFLIHHTNTSIIQIISLKILPKFTNLFLSVSFAKKSLVMFLGKTGKGFLAWNWQPFSNIIYVIQKHIEAINHITDTTDSWDVIWNVQCYALFSDFSKIKQLQPPLTHVARERCSLQPLHLMSRSIKKCNSEVFWELCMCCQHDEHSHNIYVTTTTKNRAKGVLGDSKFVQIMNIQPTEEIACHLTCLW